MFYALGDMRPRVSHSAYVHPQAVVIGEVSVGPHATVWPAVVLRGDHGAVHIGSWTAIQDGTVVHGNRVGDTVVGDRTVVGHLAHLEGCRIGDGCLVGSGAMVLPLCEVEDEAVVGAGAVLPRGTRVPTGSTALGVPAQVRSGMGVPARVAGAVVRHAELGERYHRSLSVLDPADVVE